MAETETWTIGRLLTWTTDFLKRNGSDSPRLDAEVLLAHVRGCQRIQLYTAFEEVASDELRAGFRELVTKRSKGVPVAYLVGRKEFYSLPFCVTPAVLIPRPETEFLVVEALDVIKKSGIADRPVEIIDVGTGSGCIAITVAKHAKNANVLAVDISPDALEVAQKNADDLGVAERIEFLESDLFAAVDPVRQFDLVLSNPPYIGEYELESLSRDVRDHEPRGALISGATGTETIARLIPHAAKRLHVGGWLIFEISPLIEAQVRQLVEADPRFSPPVIVKDLAGLPRYVKARRQD